MLQFCGEIVSASGYNEIEPVVDGGLSGVKQTPKLLDEVHTLLYTAEKSIHDSYACFAGENAEAAGDDAAPGGTQEWPRGEVCARQRQGRPENQQDEQPCKYMFVI